LVGSLIAHHLTHTNRARGSKGARRHPAAWSSQPRHRRTRGVRVFPGRC